MIFLHILIAFILFLITNWFGKKSLDYGYYQFSFYEYESHPAFNILYRAFSPTVFIFVLSILFNCSGLDEFIENIYFVVIYSCVIRVIFIILVGRSSVIDWYKLIVTSVLAIAISYIVYTNFIENRKFLIPDEKDIATAIWFSLVAYIYRTLNMISSSERDQKRNRDYILTSYEKLHSKYNIIISELTDKKEEVLMIYAVMIYENFNRNLFVRFLEKMFFFTGRIKTTGIMQVNSDSYLSDMESVKKGSEILLAEYRSQEVNDEYYDYYCLRNSIKKYNPDIRYIENVMGIYSILKDKYITNE